MPFASLRSRPGTSASQRRPYSNYEPSPPKSDAAGPSPRKRVDSLKRLSLDLHKSNGESFQRLFNQETDEIARQPKAVAAEQQEKQKDNSPPPAAMEPQSSASETPYHLDAASEQEPIIRPQRILDGVGTGHEHGQTQEKLTCKGQAGAGARRPAKHGELGKLSNQCHVRLLIISAGATATRCRLFQPPNSLQTSERGVVNDYVYPT